MIEHPAPASLTEGAHINAPAPQQTDPVTAAAAAQAVATVEAMKVAMQQKSSKLGAALASFVGWFAMRPKLTLMLVIITTAACTYGIIAFNGVRTEQADPGNEFVGAGFFKRWGLRRDGTAALITENYMGLKPNTAVKVFHTKDNHPVFADPGVNSKGRPAWVVRQ